MGRLGRPQQSPYPNRQRNGAQTSDSVGSTPTGGTKFVIQVFDTRPVHPPQVRATALQLHAEGVALPLISDRLSVPLGTLVSWLYRKQSRPLGPPRTCWRCSDPPAPAPDAGAYAYLLGQYLGDGYLALTARVPVLRICCANAYPVIMAECETAMRQVLAKSVQRVPREGCTFVQAYSRHWPCLLPQAGPGRKHERSIVLEQWQRALVAREPGRFVRGLFHSDGCRVVNQVTVRGRGYQYPRYFFGNESRDILALCEEALDLLGVAWRRNRGNSLSVARREAVSTLDVHVGVKR